MLTKANATAALVKDARTNRGWNHQDMCLAVIRHPDLGRRYQISANTIRNIENGRTRTPRVRAMFAVATVLEFTVSDLWPSA